MQMVRRMPMGYFLLDWLPTVPKAQIFDRQIEPRMTKSRRGLPRRGEVRRRVHAAERGDVLNKRRQLHRPGASKQALVEARSGTVGAGVGRRGTLCRLRVTTETTSARASSAGR
jgi:hypothetical protein